MWPSDKMEAVVGRRRYRVGDARLLAHDSYWDGSNYERHGRNTFLYKTPKGAYFAVRLSLWEGERDRIEPLPEEEAYELYEGLPVREVEAEDAFPRVAIDTA